MYYLYHLNIENHLNIINVSELLVDKARKYLIFTLFLINKTYLKNNVCMDFESKYIFVQKI